MNLNDYIESGILELYVYGLLPREESIEVSKKLQEYPELRDEVEQIESALQQLGTALAPHDAKAMLDSINSKIQTPPIALAPSEQNPKKKRNGQPISVGPPVFYSQ